MRIAELAAFGVGSALCLSWLESIAGYGAVVGAGALLMLVYLAAGSAPRAFVRRIAMGLLLAMYAAFFYFASAFGILLAWTLSPAVVALTLAVLVLALAGAYSNARLPRIALCLPLGMWTAAVLVGWLREDGLVRCDDYRRVADNPATRIVIPTNTAFRSCVPGEVLVLGRYPRRIWQSDDGRYLVFTTQPGVLRFFPHGRHLAEQLPGSVCSAPLDGSSRPRCLGAGKAQGIAESVRHDRLFVGVWGRFKDGAHGAVYAVTRPPPLRLLSTRHFPESTGELFYDERSDTLGLLSDEGKVMLPVQAAGLVAGKPRPAPVIPGETRYNQGLGEGVFCFAAGPLKPIHGVGYAAVAFRGAPFSIRPLAPTTRYPSSWLDLTWGCNWDAKARRVYVAVSDLGLLLTIDYDSGRILERHWVGLGMRSVAIDAPRHRLYLADFLRGRVLQWDLSQARQTRSWFVGRFVRYVLLARDGRSLFASSNLGVVQIPL